MKICIFGFSVISKAFIELFNDIPEIEIVCYCDNNSELWQKKDKKDRLVYAVYKVRRLLEEGVIDSVYISGNYRSKGLTVKNKFHKNVVPTYLLKKIRLYETCTLFY